jgi:hypothetical protein
MSRAEVEEEAILLELISIDLIIRIKFISHVLIGGVFSYSWGSGTPLHSAYK